MVEPVLPIEDITPDWAWGGSTGEGVKVAVIDSGIDGNHPEIGGRLYSVSVLGRMLFGRASEPLPSR